ncbi:hypothetical protein GALMADRAFT_216383 [Galerina marginata CBS 339.88]|uniref:Uncharacterized protein n=1 Tax=Galerina marginata (strain CBS 339.88) TaxID=685588 RepID=A0A067SC30_GALM3|nr:hypothetical protein GALMADRAFT_216383 [Galerina marginata CBS 339.88]
MPRYTQPRTGYNKPLLPVPVSKFVDGLPVYGSTTETSAWRVYVPPPYIPPPYRRRWPDGERVYPLDRSELLESNAKRPINQLPPEVLAEIFLKFVEDDKALKTFRTQLRDSNRPLVSKHTDADPILLGHVCSYWRAVALTTPMLWATISILHPKKSQIRLLQLWLERAGSHPLELSILEEQEPSHIEANAARDVILSVTARRRYWKSIIFDITTDTLAVIVPLLQSPVPLEHLDSVELHLSIPSKSGPVVHTHHLLRDPDVYLDDVWSLFHSCSTLRRINWGHAYSDITFPAHCPGHQLSDITLYPDISLAILMELLSLCSNLEQIRVQALCLPSGTLTTYTHNPVLLSKLHTLNVTADTEVAPLFRCLTLPALRCLQLHYRLPDSVSRDSEGFCDFLSRSNCVGLETFQLIDGGSCEEDLLNYFDSSIMRNLKYLRLNSRITDGVVRRLTVGEPSHYPVLMPSLETVILKGCVTSDGVLSGMVLSRWSPKTFSGRCTPLKEVWITAKGTYGSIDEGEFARMRRGGLDINA